MWADNKRRRAAFSLIEVNMAILIIAIGMLSLMSLFPLGLRESSLAHGDMLQAATADYILGRVRAEAQQVTAFSEWRNTDAMRNRLAGEFTRSGIGTLPNFPGDGDCMRYRLRIDRSQRQQIGGIDTRSDWIYGIAVQSTERRSGDFVGNTWFYTEVIFHGDP